MAASCRNIAIILILVLAGTFLIVACLLGQAKKNETVTSFDFPILNASSLNDIVLKQNANAHDNRIYLTKSGALDNFNGSLGWAVYKFPIRLWNKQFPRVRGFKSLYQWRKKLPPFLGSFQCHFQFNVDGAVGEKNGLAFFMAPFGTEPPPANESSAMWLGIFSTSTNGTAPSQAVAIEFDSNHVGLHVDNISAVASNLLPGNQRLNNGNITLDAWIEYNATGMALSVFLANVSSKPAEPILQTEDVNFSQILPLDVVIGFSASTTGVNMNIISWKFSSQTPGIRKTPVAVIILAMLFTTMLLGCVPCLCCCRCETVSTVSTDQGPGWGFLYGANYSYSTTRTVIRSTTGSSTVIQTSSGYGY